MAAERTLDLRGRVVSLSRERTEEGVATVAAVAVVGFALLVAAALVQVALVVAAKHRAQAAADLAALAGSAASLRGADGCATAGAVARRNGVKLASCRVDLAVVTLRADALASVMWGGRFRTSADARAAPDFYVASRSKRSSSRTAPDLSRGSLPLPHFGD